MMMPILPLFARILGATEVELGFISIVPSLVMIVGSVPGSIIGVRFGKKALFMLTGALGILCAFGFSVVSRIALLYLPQAVFGLSNTLFWPAQSAYLTELVPERMRAQVIGYTLAVSGTGMMLGPTVGGLIADTLGYRSVFLLYALMASCSIVVATRLPRLETSAGGPALGALVSGMSGVGRLLKRPMLGITAISMFMMSINQGMTDSFYPVFLREIGYSATVVGTIVTTRTTGITLVRLTMGLLTQKMGAAPLLFTGIGVCALMQGLAPLYPAPGFVYVSSFLMGVGFGVAPVLATTIIAENTDSKERATGLALDMTCSSSGRVAGGMVIGAVAQATALGPALVGGNLAVLGGIGMLVLRYSSLVRRRKIHAPERRQGASA